MKTPAYLNRVREIRDAFPVMKASTLALGATEASRAMAKAAAQEGPTAAHRKVTGEAKASGTSGYARTEQGAPAYALRADAARGHESIFKVMTEGRTGLVGIDDWAAPEASEPVEKDAFAKAFEGPPLELVPLPKDLTPEEQRALTRKEVGGKKDEHEMRFERNRANEVAFRHYKLNRFEANAQLQRFDLRRKAELEHARMFDDMERRNEAEVALAVDTWIAGRK